MNPISTVGENVRIDAEKAKAWIAKGAQPSDPVRRLLAELGLCEKAPIYPKKAAPAAAPAAAAE